LTSWSVAGAFSFSTVVTVTNTCGSSMRIAVASCMPLMPSSKRPVTSIVERSIWTTASCVQA